MTSRSICSAGPAVLVLVVTCLSADAQVLPPPGASPPPSQNQACIRLESQLAAVDRGMSDPARADQIHRYEEAARQQQAELDRMVAQARRMGCEGSGFFLFGGGQGPQCGDINSQIQRMRASLDRMNGDLARLQGGSVDHGEQRRAILIALAQNQCGPQYASVAPPRPRGFFEQLFGAPSTPSGPGPDAPNPDVPQSSTYRTICVRSCDGFYFPISFSTVPSKFADDDRQCQRECPAAEVTLFSHRNPGEDVSQAVSIAGKRYTDLPNAFRYRQEYNAACSCRKPGQSWAEALGQNDQTIERGDIVITDERAKTMSQPPQPKTEPAKPARADARKGKTDAKTIGETTAPVNPAATDDPAPATPEATPEETHDKRKVRAVGPQFVPVR